MRTVEHKTKVALICIAAFLLIIAVLAMALLIPRTGKRRVDVWSAGDKFSIEEVQSIEAGDKQFKILMFTDLQLWMDVSDNNETFAMMDELVEKTSPDMIVMPGDNVSGLVTDLYLRQLIKKMESYKIPWACTFGNHDAEGNATLAWQSDRYEEAEYCLFERGPSNLYGMGNYAVNITRDGKADKTLFFLDNGRYYDYADGADEIWMGYEQNAAPTIKGVEQAHCRRFALGRARFHDGAHANFQKSAAHAVEYGGKQQSVKGIGKQFGQKSQPCQPERRKNVRRHHGNAPAYLVHKFGG